MFPLFKTLTGLALRNPALAGFVRQRQRVTLTSLCFHRFSGPVGGAPGHDLHAVEEGLRWLTRAGFVFADFGETVRELAVGKFPRPGTVIVSIDDGYADLASAIPVFARYGCPVTVFLATGFLDNRAPLWWDQVQMLLAKAPGRAELDNVAGITWKAAWNNAHERLIEGELLIERIKRAQEPARQAVVEALARHVGVSLPLQETVGYEPLRWDDVRALEREGVRFGPHTHTHPILSSMETGQARAEIEQSWSRLRSEVQHPLPVLAYPDGTPWSYTERDRDLARKIGLEAAVTMDAQWVLPPEPPVDLYRIGRMAYQSKLADLQISALRLSARSQWRYPGKP